MVKTVQIFATQTVQRRETPSISSGDVPVQDSASSNGGSRPNEATFNSPKKIKKDSHVPVKGTKGQHKAIPRKKVARRPSSGSDASQAAAKNRDDAPMLDTAREGPQELPVTGHSFSDQIDLTESIAKPMQKQKSCALPTATTTSVSKGSKSGKATTEPASGWSKIRSTASDEVTETGGRNDKHYKKFDFFYRRTAFRSMTEFYKGLFKPILDKWREGERKSTKNFVLSYFWKLSDMEVQQQHAAGKTSSRDIKKLANFSKSPKNPLTGQRHCDPVERKITAAIQETFQRYSTGRVEVKMPICDGDKKTLKQNMRKLAIYDSAYRFCDELFDFESMLPDDEDDMAIDAQHDDRWVDTPMTERQLLEFSSGILSIVLSHHFQKDDIKRITHDTSVDFAIVRDTMYKYSKRAEENFFRNSCMAFFFVQFAKGRHGRAYIESKLTRNAEQAAQACKSAGVDPRSFAMTSGVSFGGAAAEISDIKHSSIVSFDEPSSSKFQKDGEINSPATRKKQGLLQHAASVSSSSKLGQPRTNQNIDPETALERQNILNERIIAEIEMMCEEAQAFLQSTFERELTDFLVNHEDRYQLMNVPPERRLEAFKALVRQHLLSFLLLENLSVDVDKELKEKLDWLNQHNYDPVITPQKPLLDSILEDINRRQITRKPVTSFLQTVKGEDERPNPATQPSLFSGSVDPFQASAGGSNSFITPSKKPVRPSNSNAKTQASSVMGCTTASRTAGATTTVQKGTAVVRRTDIDQKAAGTVQPAKTQDSLLAANLLKQAQNQISSGIVKSFSNIVTKTSLEAEAMQEVLDLVVDNANGGRKVQPFASPMIKAPCYGNSSGTGSKPQDTPQTPNSGDMVGGSQAMRFMHGQNKAYEMNQIQRRGSDLFNDGMNGRVEQFDTPEDLKKQNSTPVRRGRQPEMSGQLGASLMSLKNQANLWNCTSVGAFANQPNAPKPKQDRKPVASVFSPTLIKPVGKQPSEVKPQQPGDIGRQQLFNKLMELITRKRDTGLASDAHSNESSPQKIGGSPQDSKACADLE